MEDGDHTECHRMSPNVHISTHPRSRHLDLPVLALISTIVLFSQLVSNLNPHVSCLFMDPQWRLACGVLLDYISNIIEYPQWVVYYYLFDCQILSWPTYSQSNP